MDELYNKIIEKVKELTDVSNEARLKIQVTILFCFFQLYDHTQHDERN